MIIVLYSVKLMKITEGKTEGWIGCLGLLFSLLLGRREQTSIRPNRSSTQRKGRFLLKSRMAAKECIGRIWALMGKELLTGEWVITKQVHRTIAVA